jgi:hypothetical protein
MHYLSLAPVAALFLALGSFAQGPIYVCGGNEFTNTVPEAKKKSNCKLFEGGNVTVVQGFRPPVPAAATAQPVKVAAAPQSTSRVDASEQKSRDSDARLILESELKKAESRQTDLLREYNNGEPEKRGGEAQNYQKYVERVAELKASLARNESDIAGIRRELGRVPASK